ncbi:protein-L-histidine N-pros-methyltransferase [Chrysoperla carnea]|uniref:protein-L-histidine N-pros-methyltransferase n=1 Tax=Chrysoperla carnea TaxID=189513 RepID=UPI001D07AAE6|nr:protein-L-histidine N-pros-methyltransferase [Chrysoperla carnea]
MNNSLKSDENCVNKSDTNDEPKTLYFECNPTGALNDEHSAAAASPSCNNYYDDNYDSTVTRVLKHYRPRGALARALYQKQISDEQLRNFDKNQWYKCNLNGLPNELTKRFLPLSLDEDTNQFLIQSEEKSEWILTQLWHTIAKAFLGWFMTQTSINGWLGRGSMFVFSTKQFCYLLNLPYDWVGESCLDLGAGDGAVTARVAPLFKEVYVTEISNQMRYILQKQNFKILDIDNWHLDHKFDVIMCLNLLDRCDRPLDILQKMHSSLTPGGHIVIALVLPFSPYVETGGDKSHLPTERLNITGRTFEKQVFSFWQNVLIPNGFELERWSRVPYLCEGDINQSFYYLDDAIFIVKKAASTIN